MTNLDMSMSTDDNNINQRVKEAQDYIDRVQAELTELMDYGNQVLSCVARDDQENMPNSLELLANRCVVYAAGGEAYGEAIAILKRFYALIHPLPREAYTESMMDIIHMADNNGGIGELEERQLFLYGHVSSISEYLKRKKREPLGLLIWAVLMVIAFVLHIFI